MARYAMIEATGLVANVVEWDGNTETWQPPTGFTMIEIADDSPVGPGWTYDGADFARPLPPPAPPGTLTPIDQQILAAPDTLFGGPTIREVFDVYSTGN